MICKFCSVSNGCVWLVGEGGVGAPLALEAAVVPGVPALDVGQGGPHHGAHRIRAQKPRTNGSGARC